MPKGDGTGPQGDGPGTGRRRGSCNAAEQPKASDKSPSQSLVGVRAEGLIKRLLARTNETTNNKLKET